ncbi:MAG: DUF3124 domain-containing protein [Ardenticatenaceae bacterium]|nr:DUF3124 domain-containing protein [Ardenticatenaceae bacterium]
MNLTHKKTKPALITRLTVFTKLQIIIVFIGFFVACSSQSPNQASSEPSVAIQDLDITIGQTIYVPAYSKIYASPRGQTLDLTVTLSIHNTDMDYPIFLTSVRYYDAKGEFVREYLPTPLHLPPLGTADFYVDEDGAENEDLGTNFIVEWGAEQEVYEPIVEAIMIHADSNQGISFTSPGRVISQLSSEEE